MGAVIHDLDVGESMVIHSRATLRLDHKSGRRARIHIIYADAPETMKADAGHEALAELPIAATTAT